MADGSENPQDKAKLDRVSKDLGGLVDDLSSELRQAQDLTKEAQVDRDRAQADRVAAKKEAQARGTRSPTPGGKAAEGIPTEEIQAQAKAINEQATAEERATRATRDRSKATVDAAEAVKRARQAEYLAKAGDQYGSTAGPGAAPGPAMGSAAQVQARVEADRRAAELRLEAERQARNNQYASPIGPPRRPGVQQYPGPIGPITSQAVQQAAVGTFQKAEAADKDLQAALRAIPATKQLNGALAEQARALGLASDAYTRHGYLTSEFIAAAGRGEVTFKELGNQVGGTIAKFAGWTAAATAVYGVVGAMGALYQGALTAASGVDLVGRVTTKELPGGADELQQSFRDNAKKFNLPMEDIVQATYGAAKATGGDLPQALQAAEQALFGVKVGELSAADSTRYLQSIMRGFGASASELPAIFDAINQAQNRFGGSTGDMIAGVAKAAGIFKLAGGDYRQLIALITTGTRLTGATGGEVATAISRSASRILTPQGADALRGVGIDPNQKYGAILAEASRKAQAGTPAEVNQIARALVPQGGQYARILAPILQNRELYNKVFGELDPNKASGSADRELKKALQQPNEQLKSLITNLERLGSTLAQAGGLNLLVGMVKLLNTGLDLTVRLVDAFNAITPAPLRQVLTPLLQMAVILKGLQRFDVGASLPQGRDGSAYGRFREGLRRSPDSRADAQITQGLGDEQRFLEDGRRKAAAQSANATYQADRAETRAIEARQHHEAQPLGSPERDTARDRMVAANTVYQQRMVEAARLSADQVDFADRTVATQKQLLEYEKLKKAGYDAQESAMRAGIQWTNPTLNRPVAEQPVRVGATTPTGPGGAPVTVIPPGGPSSPATAADAAAEKAAAVKQETAAQASRRMWAERQRAARDLVGLSVPALPALPDQARLAAEAARASKAGKALEATTRTAGVALKSAGNAMAAGFSGLRNLGGTTLSALDSAFLAIPAAIAIWGKIDQSIKAGEEQVRQLQSTAGGPEGIDARVQAYRDGPSNHASLRDPIGAIGIGIRRTQSQFARGLNAIVPYSPARDRAGEQDAAAAQAEQTAEMLRKAQEKNALLYIPQVQANFKSAMASAQTPAEIDAALKTGLRELDHGYASALGDKNARTVAARVKADFKAQVAALAASRGDLSEAAKQITDSASLKAFTGHVQTAFGLQGVTNANLQGAGVGISAARAQIGLDPTSAADQLAQINTLEGEVQQQVNSRMSRLLPLAKSPAAAGDVRSDALQQLRTGLTSGLQSDIAATEKRIKDAKATLADPVAQAINAANVAVGGSDNLKILRGKLGTDNNRLKQLQEGLKQENEVVSQFEAEQQRAQFQLEQGVFDATTTVEAGKVHNPVEALRLQLRRNRSRLDDIAKEYGKESTEYLQALAQEQQLQDQIVQAEISKIQTSAQLRAAQTTNPVVAAQVTLDGTNRAIAELAKRGRQQTEQYQQLLISKAQQQQQLVQAQIGSFQSAQQLNRARANIGATQATQLTGALSDAQGFAAYIQSLGADASPEQINSALTAVAQAQGALADYARQQAQAMVQAQADFAKSRTTDPVKQAAIDVRTAQQQVQFAQTPAERTSALAQVQNAQRAEHDVKLQDAENDIAFQREMDQISVATAIAKYRTLLKDKELSKAQKQDILRKIKGLEDESASGYNIDAANIKLPTPYEVFRAVKEGKNAQTQANLRGAVQNNNRVTIIVNDKKDVQAVADVFDQLISTDTASSLRAMGF